MICAHAYTWRKNGVAKEAIVLQWAVRTTSWDFKPGKKQWAGAQLSGKCCCFLFLYQYAAILQYDIMQYNSIHFNISIYCTGQYIAVYCAYCMNWNWITGIECWQFVSIKKLWKSRAINLVVLKLAECILTLPVTGLIITKSVLQYSNILWTSCMKYAICQFAVLWQL